MKAREWLENIDTKTVKRLKDFKEGLHKKKLIALFETCNACGGNLSFAYQKDFSRALMIEEGHCKTCKAQSSRHVFKIV